MPLFTIPKRADRDSDLKAIQKAKSNQRTVAKSNSLIDKIERIRGAVETSLGKYKDAYEIITTQERLSQYLGSAIYQEIISIDTETSGLDPMLDELVGICIYTPGEPSAYIPLNHKSYITGEKIAEQLDIETVRGAFKELLKAKPDIIMFNAKFDIRFLRNQLGLKDIYCTWDCYLASRLLNENEPKKGLKALHQKYVLRNKEDEFSFEALFSGVEFAKVPVNVAYMYAAHDAIITYELYEFQKKHLDINSDREDLRNVAWVFHNIEMPCVAVVCDMEDAGIELDIRYAEQLSRTYNEQLKECEANVRHEINKYADKIAEYRRKHPSNKLDEPINFNSTTQLAILLYDVIGLEPIDRKSPRGTGVNILSRLNNPICGAVLEYRAVAKLLSTYIDKLPGCVNPNDGRIHCSFNQYGADTGRFSSSDPNLQNIPSHNKDIRKMFKATDGYVLMSSDYSQQEPKVMTQMCGDPKMIKAYQEGKDLYAEIAALSFNTSYENCLEFRPDGTTNPEGKNRRSQAKSILLGVLYGRGVPSIAEQLGTTTEKAQRIKDSVFKGFPAIPKFEEDSLEMAYERGFVTTLWGRKRRLPDLQLPEFEFRYREGISQNCDLLDFGEDEGQGISGVQEVPEEIQNKYLRRLRQARFGEKRKIFEEANKEGIWIVDNGGKIADAQRQCVNARIQGSAADMSKLAMILVGNDSRLRELGFRLLIPVHDELIAECPFENAKECRDRFAQLMSEAAESRLSIPIKCDVEVTKNWYGNKVELAGD